MIKTHSYLLRAKWTGNSGAGTETYRGYERSVTISAEGKADILSSSGTAFNGDKTKYNPEELLVAAVSSCHMLWYLHLCSEAGVIVESYFDDATGTMSEENGIGKFSEIVLHPHVSVRAASMVAKAHDLHEAAGNLCYIANSLNFAVKYEPIITVA